MIFQVLILIHIFYLTTNPLALTNTINSGIVRYIHITRYANFINSRSNPQGESILLLSSK